MSIQFNIVVKKLFYMDINVFKKIINVLKDANKAFTPSLKN
jgi:hypothetical protein